MALEVFSGDGRNYLLAFQQKVRNKVYQRFMTFATAIADSAHQSVAGQKRTANVEQATGLLSNLIGETSVTQRWVVRRDFRTYNETVYNLLNFNLVIFYISSAAKYQIFNT